MGERANVLVRDNYDPGVFLYTHWGGYELPQTVQRALRREERWSDTPYLARIVFSEMIRDEIDGETGYGISSVMVGDNGYPVIVLDTSKQTVSYISEDDARYKKTDSPAASWSMEDYISLSEEEITRPYYQR